MSLNETKATSDSHLSPGTVVINIWQKFWGGVGPDFVCSLSSFFYEVKFGTFSAFVSCDPLTILTLLKSGTAAFP